MKEEQLHRVNRMAEIFWIGIIICCGVASGYFIWSDGWAQQKQSLFLPGLAAAWYVFRRFFRQRLERGSNARND
ncbi:MAG: hypothetical protein CL845_04010 [Crocinitomicaceae bacterium]|nr:hypothetical protein [Crocinitomicaceae bacterium]HBP45114.1 hypothetical protein [Flavobacteriales bacterium]|tara:strand:- start:1927 stop:2148 length:222 start_codon:yes stop_codon:yes gene_type:complete